MSTRSGKRLHHASNENIEPEITLKGDRKTRSKRVVDTSESLALKSTKKRQNYVSFPSEEDTIDVKALEDEVQVKPIRTLRRQTLKEQNAATEAVDTAITTKKQVRSTRRTKKFSETAAEDFPEVPVNEEPVEVASVTNTKTKGKKNKKKSKKEQPEVNDKENEAKAGKKKKNKKKKSSQSTNSSIVTLDKSDDNSKINITDDDSKTENILNTTPVLIESSMEESRVSVLESSLKENKTPETKPKSNKRQTLPAAGCTPYHSDRKGSQRKRILNQTHSIEKPNRRSSLAEVPSRTTHVMFCSPVNNPGVATQRKSKIIKSNLKGSNKSFVFEESDSIVWSVAPRAGRKRSLTHAGAGAEPASAKRTRLDSQRALPAARARTTSAMAKLSNAATPSKAATPKSEVKATKLPNFAALHARRFERMESLYECQQRKAKRAKQLLVPTGSVAVLERSSPRVTLEPATPAPVASKPSTLPTLDTLQRGYNRFGFKMNIDLNPFSVSKPDKPKEKPNGVKPNGLKDLKLVKPVFKREVTQPSLAGTTSLRRAVAKQTIMREKSFNLAEKRSATRKEVRTVIKGVRTNRRFELQMQSRNLNG